MSRGISLRDARRLVACGVCEYDPGVWWAWAGDPKKPQSVLLPIPQEIRYAELIRWLDQQISLRGRDAWLVPPETEGEARPKNTDEAGEVSADPDDGRLHGGDGHAGECDAPAETSGDSSRKENDHAPQQGGASGSGPGSPQGEPDGSGRNAADSTAHGAHNAEDEPDTRLGQDEGEPTDRVAPGTRPGPTGDGESTSSSRLGPCPSDGATGNRGKRRHEEGSPAPARGADADAPTSASNAGEERSADQSHGGAGGGSHSWGAKRTYGGDTTDAVTITAKLAHYRRHPAVRRCASALERLIRPALVGMGQDPSPRVDAHRLVVELVGRSVRRSHWQREELERPIVIIAADVSGSCSACSSQTWAACLLLAEQLDGVLAVQHTNGLPLTAYGPRIGIVAGGQHQAIGDEIVWWRDLMGRHKIAGAVWMGDFDGYWVVEAIRATGRPVWHLDSYSKVGGVRMLHLPLKGEPLLPARLGAYVCGVGSIEDVEIALRVVARPTSLCISASLR